MAFAKVLEEYVAQQQKLSQSNVFTDFAEKNTPAAVKAHRHLTCFYVEKGTAGFSAPRIEHKLGIRGSTTAELALSDVHLPDDNRVGEVGDRRRDGHEWSRLHGRPGRDEFRSGRSVRHR